MSEWQPIETAPKDGSPILAGYWHDEVWWDGVYYAETYSFDAIDHGFSRDVSPLTHWMPLPEPPKREIAS